MAILEEIAIGVEKGDSASAIDLAKGLLEK
jgi:hypothetical protein